MISMLTLRLSFDLTGTSRVVTGGNSGIGLGMAEGLAQHGADIAIWGTNADKNDAAVDRLGRYDVEVLSIVCDVSDEDAVVARWPTRWPSWGGSTRCSSTPA